MKFVCETCDAGMGNVELWVAHLQSPGHQETTLHDLHQWTTELETRSIVVKPVTQHFPGIFTPLDFLDYFFTFGFVTDFVYYKDLSSAIIQFDVCDTDGSDELFSELHFVGQSKANMEIPSKASPLSTLTDSEKAAFSLKRPNVDSNNSSKLALRQTQPEEDAFIEQRISLKPFSQTISQTTINSKTEKTTNTVPSLASISSEGSTNLVKHSEPKSTEQSKPRPPNATTAKSTKPVVSALSAASQAKTETANQNGKLKSNPKLTGPIKLMKQHNAHMKFGFRAYHQELISHMAADSWGIEQEMEFFLNAVVMTPAEVKKREYFVSSLAVILRKDFPESILHPFGSFATTLGDRDSDVDIYIDATGCSSHGELEPEPDPDTKKQIFKSTHSCLQKSYQFIYIRPIPSARIPIIKVLHAETGVNADLSFTNLMSAQNSKLILFYTKFDSRVRPLLLLVRYWARFHDLIGVHLWKSYGIVLLVLVFLMRKGIIPSVHFLQTQVPNPELLIGKWNAGFCDCIDKVRNCHQAPVFDDHDNSARGILKLAQEFFDTFANLNFNKFAICPLTGDFLPRELFGSRELPSEFDRYKQWTQEIKQEGKGVISVLDTKPPICIQDPFDLSFNVGGGTPFTLLALFKMACSGASAQLKDLYEGRTGRLMKIFVPMTKKQKQQAWPPKKKKHQNQKPQITNAQPAAAANAPPQV